MHALIIFYHLSARMGSDKGVTRARAFVSPLKLKYYHINNVQWFDKTKNIKRIYFVCFSNLEWKLKFDQFNSIDCLSVLRKSDYDLKFSFISSNFIIHLKQRFKVKVSLSKNSQTHNNFSNERSIFHKYSPLYWIWITKSTAGKFYKWIYWFGWKHCPARNIWRAAKCSHR